MTIRVEKRDGKYRLIELETNELAVNENDVPMDGGGHEDLAKAMRQSEYINKEPRREDDE